MATSNLHAKSVIVQWLCYLDPNTSPVTSLPRHLVTYMNGTVDAETIANPSSFFSLLCTFAAGLDAAHADNVAADAKVRNTLERGGISCDMSLQYMPSIF